MTHALPPRIKSTIEAVAREHGVSVKDLMGRDRHKKIAGARRCAMRAVRAMDPVPSLTTIGRWFGLHHTTVLHACRQ